MKFSAQRFADPGVWAGGDYELKIWLGAPSDERIKEALVSLWESPMLEGPYAGGCSDRTALRRVSPDADHLFGLANIGGESLPASTFVVREEDLDGNRAADFLYVGLPLGGLGIIYAVGAYPFADIEAASIWRPEVDAWFLQLLRGLQRPFNFQLGIIGFEVALAVADARDLNCDEASGDHFCGIIRPRQNSLQ